MDAAIKRTALTAASLTPLLLLAACGGASSTAQGAPAPPVTSSQSSTRTGAGSAPSAGGAAPSTPPGAQTPVPAESNPPGDIPDNIAFVAYTNTAGHYTFRHPEGWLEQTKGATVRFTDKLNGVFVEPGTATSPPTTSTAKATGIPALKKSQAAFELRSVSAVRVPYGAGVLIVYRRNSAADPVTGRQYRDEVQRYDLVAGGHEVVMELFGPVGADNVDAYRTMVQSLRAS